MQVADQGTWHALGTRAGSSVHAHPYAIVAGLMVLVAGLSTSGLGQRFFLLDEKVSLDHARESWVGLWRVSTRADPNMSLYMAALKVWTGAFGESVSALRSLSVVAAVLCIPVVYALGAHLFGTVAGLLGALLLSTNVFFLEYAQVARTYALLTLLTASSSYFFVSESDRPRTSSRVGYVAFSVLAFYVHVFAIWVLLIQLLTVVAFKGREAWSRRWLTNFGLIAALIAPMAYTMKRVGGSGLYWVEVPDLGAIPATYAQLAGNSFLHLAIVIAACSFALRRAAHSRRLRFGFAYTAAWAFLPVLATFAASHVLQPVFIARYLIISLPAMVLLAAGAIVNVRPRVAAIVAACLLVALSVPELHSYYGWTIPVVVDVSVSGLVVP